MNAAFEFTSLATEDLDAIWWFIAADSRDAANRVEAEIAATCRRLANYPRMGIGQPDLTRLPLRFWTVTRFPNYPIVYRPETVPMLVVAVLHGKRDMRKALEGRSQILPLVATGRESRDW